MLTDVFYWLLNMSIAGSVAGIFVLLLRLIKRIPRRIVAILWALPLIRACIPVGLGGKYGLMDLVGRYAAKTVPVNGSGTKGLFALTNYVQAAESYNPLAYRYGVLETVFGISSVFWAIGAAALLLTFTILYITTIREMRSAKLLYENVYSSDKVTSPAVYGVFRPRIVIPAALDGDGALPLCLQHEKQHIRRLDNLWRILAFAATAVHWFNPLFWIFLRCFLADIEIACDEAVLQKLGEDEKKAYARALLSGAESKTLFVSAFGGAKIRTRIAHIFSFKKMTVFSAVLFALLIAAVAYFLLTNAP